ncbi:hypothetical protein [Gordonia sp. (in: high G+C Gram-positive bacteria)]|uniref:hypothetical protein n=1 Tax=Gordonia sp. (in: high G+C Gram-positive bacteria) TaxID=84139 RepID=UPI003C778824
MLALVAIVPSAPLLVPELAGPAAVEAEAVRGAVREVADQLASAASSWIAVGAADLAGGARGSIDYSGTGEFGAYGVSVPVNLGKKGESTGSQPLPLSMLIACWIRGEVAQDISITPFVVDPEASPAECAARGRELAALLSATPEPVGVLVVADGSTALSSSAPGGGLRESAVELQQMIDTAIAAADCEAITELDPSACAVEGVGGRAAWQTAAAACTTPLAAKVDYCAAPFGVGYTVATWTPVGCPPVDGGAR